MIEKAKEFLFRRKTAYVRVFKSQAGDEVLKDLARFCRAGDSTFHTDPRVSAVLQGRHEVFLRILQHLKLSQDDLWEIYSGKMEKTE